jgi:NAD(P)-dependent dehydrogenase (short-subunit alcohol dehydrogenase family)
MPATGVVAAGYTLEQLSEVILVTGSTDGLGRALASELAARDSRVLLHGRDREKGEAALREIHEASAGVRPHGSDPNSRDSETHALHIADFSSLAAVRGLADRVLAEYERLGVLVNNVGIGTAWRGRSRREVSEDGHELRFAVNYLAPFLLTRLLEPLLVRSAPSRIVNVASAGQAAIDFDDVMLERDYSGVQAYCQSKLADVMLTFDLADELRNRGVTANCLHPGTYMPTKMVLETGVSPIDSLESGVEATLRLVANPELDGVTGKYYDRLREARAHPQAYDLEARRRLFELSAELVGLSLES